MLGRKRQVGLAIMVLTRTQVREIDRRAIEDFGVPSIVLMENAGRGAAELGWRLFGPGPVAICCGKGNNAGDGLVIARHLDNRQVAVRVLLLARPEELSEDAVINFNIISRSALPISVCVPYDDAALQRELASTAWIVDALFGTGLSGAVRPPFDQVIAAINVSGRPVLAVDIPSGLDCDTGQPLGATVQATHTVTFVAEKMGFAQPTARPWLGQVSVVDIGAPRILVSGVCGLGR
jgi:NAD(P)H-hydrate epimerase